MPSSTYRVQLHAGFDFDDAARIVAYLGRLGVSHMYCSPYLQAEPGSTHGYDVVDPTHVNLELGGEAGRQRLLSALAATGLGQVLDIVPNHMAADAAHNLWWRDVLANGRGSRYAHYFDIDWEAAHNKVVLPVLGRQVDDIVRDGELRVDASSAPAVIRYYEHSFPIAPNTLTAESAHDIRSLLARQHYELAYWRTGLARVNYRRFFDIASLVGVSVELDDVFEATHELIAHWLADGSLAGVRVDHPDGLRDPARYFARLRDGAPGAWIVAEKILEPGEELPDWPVAGTTGYDHLNAVLGLFVDPVAEPAFTRFYEEFTGHTDSYDAVVRAAKTDVLNASFKSDLAHLSRTFHAVGREVGSRFSTHDVESALACVLVSFPVYRTYATSRSERLANGQTRYVADAIASARAQTVNPQVLDLVEQLLLGERTTPSSGEFVARFQQATGPLMAKGVEDTAFYRYNRLVALNEVGGDPATFGTTVAQFHDRNVRQAARWPQSMLATSTHDTKRSEDVRARLAVLTEVADEWIAAVGQWSALNDEHKTNALPDRDMEYVLYQALVGAHPLSPERARDYMLKAAREGKRHTSWLEPNSDYENALTTFVERCLGDQRFWCSLESFVAQIVWPGRVNSMAQKLITLTSVGVPDVYQGTELWDLSLVDPDNRRAVDFDLRARLLDDEEKMTPEEVIERADEGLPKLRVVRRALNLRHKRPEVFAHGAYLPLEVSGARREHVIAFTRAEEVATVVPRWVAKLDGDWGETVITLPGGAWTNELTGDPVAGGKTPVRELFSRFPVALLTAA